MSLIKSISGIRGTIGGRQGEALTPPDIVKFTMAFAHQRMLRTGKQGITVVTGRDARVSGEMVNRLVTGTLMAMGADVIDCGLSTTPTVEMAVMEFRAEGGIILTASHNPAQWNALKLLDEKGEFLSGDDGKEILEIANRGEVEFAPHDKLGKITVVDDMIDRHIRKILSHHLINTDLIKKAGLKIVIDCVSSTGGIALPPLLKELGVKEIVELHCDPDGRFPHNPEPLPENIRELCDTVKGTGADLGFVVDPDVDRLAIVTERGEVFGEEYTLVAVADYVLSKRKGAAVSNLSSSRALGDVCKKHRVDYFASAVGEVNVVKMMKAKNAVIGGEGNGGVILPDLHYGRDALAGIALFLSFLAESGISCSELRKRYPDYHMVKDRLPLTEQTDIDHLLKTVAKLYKDNKVTTVDGVKIDFEEGWVHLRKSNTEPIIRIYSEAVSHEKALELVNGIKSEISKA